MEKKNDIIEELHGEPKNGEKTNEPKEGQRGFLCSNKESFRCPSLSVDGTKELSPEKVEFLESFFTNIIRIEILLQLL